MSNQLARLMENINLRDFLAKNAIKSLERYDINNVVDMYEKAFEEIL